MCEKRGCSSKRRRDDTDDDGLDDDQRLMIYIQENDYIRLEPTYTCGRNKRKRETYHSRRIASHVS